MIIILLYNSSMKCVVVIIVRVIDILHTCVAGNLTNHEEEIPLGFHLEKTHILLRDAVYTHVASHFLTLEHVARVLTHTSGTVGAVGDGDTVRGAKTAEVVSLHDTCKAFTSGDAGDVEILARDKVAGINLPTDRKKCVGSGGKGSYVLLGVNASLVEVAKERLRNVLLLLVGATKLY